MKKNKYPYSIKKVWNGYKIAYNGHFLYQLSDKVFKIKSEAIKMLSDKLKGGSK